MSISTKLNLTHLITHPKQKIIKPEYKLIKIVYQQIAHDLYFESM